MMKTLRNIPSALVAAQKTYDNLQVQKQYVLALQSTQIFEQTLRIILLGFIEKIRILSGDAGMFYQPNIDENLGLNDILNRIRTFLPEGENRDFYKSVVEASRRRNDFVHKSFRVKGNNLVDLDMNDFYLREDAREVLMKWMSAYQDVIRMMTKIIDEKLKGVKLRTIY